MDPARWAPSTTAAAAGNRRQARHIDRGFCSFLISRTSDPDRRRVRFEVKVHFHVPGAWRSSGCYWSWGSSAADRLCRGPGGAGGGQQHLCPHRAAAQPGEHDAADRAATLGRVGFDVTTVRVADRVAMNEALRAFTRESAARENVP